MFNTFLNFLGALITFFALCLSRCFFSLEGLGNKLDLADDVAFFIENFALSIDLLSGTVGDLALRKPCDWLTVFVKYFTFLIDFEAFENVQVRKFGDGNFAGFLSSLLLGFLNLLS